MDTTFEHKIRQRAYEIWRAAGMSEGDAERHWLHAEHVVRNEAEVPTTPSETTAAAVAGSTKPARPKVAKTKSAAPKLVTGAKVTGAKVGETNKAGETKAVAVKTAAPRRPKTAPAEATA